MTAAVNEVTAEVISIGDEMTSGARLDTNSQWLSQQLESLGIRVLYHTTVGDRLDANREVFLNATRRADIVVSTGGLGPTEDDLTRQALADAFDRPLLRDPTALAAIAAMFERRGRVMAPRNAVQADFPSGSRMIANPHGTAPGIELSVPRVDQAPAVIYALPGVPAEMQQMWQQTVAERIRQSLQRARVTRSLVIKCFGAGESELEEKLGGMIARDHVPQVGITVSRATIALRIRATAESESEAESQIQRTRQQIYERVGQWIFGEGDEYELPDAVLDRLQERNETLMVVELGHDGLADQWLSSRERNRIYLGGLTLTNADTIASLAAAKVLEGFNLEAPSRDVEGERISRFLHATCGVTWVLAIDEYPALGDSLRMDAVSGKSLHQVRLLLTRRGEEKPWRHAFSLGGHPDILRHRIAKTALDWFWRTLAEFHDSPGI